MSDRCNNKRIDFSYENVMKISSGKHGHVYLDNYGRIIRFYDEDVDRDCVLDLETVDKLKNIETRTILLPVSSIYYNDEFSGYSLEFIDKSRDRFPYLNMNSNLFISCLDVIEEDIDNLSNNYVLLNNITPNNVNINNSGIYLTDPTDYMFMEESSSKSLRRVNRYQVQTVLSKLILKEFRDNGCNFSRLSRVSDELVRYDEDCGLSDFYGDLLKNKAKVKELGKKM